VQLEVEFGDGDRHGRAPDDHLADVEQPVILTHDVARVEVTGLHPSFSYEVLHDCLRPCAS
jgi:hypothetical protein